MLTLNTSITYPLLLILSTTKRSFEGLSKIIKKSGDSIKRMLIPVAASFGISHKIAQHIFKDCKLLTLAIDDTLIQKIYSRCMVGTGRFFDTKIGRSIIAYRLIAGVITNGTYAIPISSGFLFAKELLSKADVVKSKLDFVKEFFLLAQQLFPNTKIRIAADGLFASIEFFAWCLENNIEADVRMHSNRKVEFKGKHCKLSKITCLRPRGRQMARTIQVKWHSLALYITAERRINKHNEESIVFIASTYQHRPRNHVIAYKRRWPIEKIFRTTKQYMGLEECFSTQLETQEAHVAAVLLSYSIAQLEMKNKNLDTPEDAIKAIKSKKLDFLIRKFARSDQIFGDIYA